ncbi:UNVERIFIED_CONTAM: hypothetical protein Sradi_3320300 [Sesamum radiatum]|uniref:Uncharacterized protein n=1 Tax=Sesamum radiatum TaxID=300843 RepID=A0AAW2R1W8_SESRA
MTGIPDSDSRRLVLGLEESWQSRAHKGCILDMASGGCVAIHGNHKPYPVQSKYVARTVDSKRGSAPCQRPPIVTDTLPLDAWQSLEREVRKLHQQVTIETLPTEPGVPFSERIMAEELPAHFGAPEHLPIYDGSTNPVEHIRKFENAALLNKYTDSIKCLIFLTTLTGSAQHSFDQLLAGSVRSFAEFSSLFQHQFASSPKYIKSAISLF